MSKYSRETATQSSIFITCLGLGFIVTCGIFNSNAERGEYTLDKIMSNEPDLNLGHEKFEDLLTKWKILSSLGIIIGFIQFLHSGFLTLIGIEEHKSIWLLGNAGIGLINIILLILGLTWQMNLIRLGILYLCLLAFDAFLLALMSVLVITVGRIPDAILVKSVDQNGKIQSYISQEQLVYS